MVAVARIDQDIRKVVRLHAMDVARGAITREQAIASIDAWMDRYVGHICAVAAATVATKH